MNGNFKDTRLIEAFDHIDPKYIAEVGESLKLRSVYTKEGEQPKNKLHINIKQITALAACVLLLVFAMPLFGYVANVIGSFAAGTAGTDTQIPNTSVIEESESVTEREETTAEPSEMEKKYSVYGKEETGTNGEKTFYLYTEDQHRDIYESRYLKERTLSYEDVVYIINDSIRLYFEYDKIIFAERAQMSGGVYEVMSIYWVEEFNTGNNVLERTSYVTPYHGDFSELSDGTVDDPTSAEYMYRKMLLEIYAIIHCRLDQHNDVRTWSFGNPSQGIPKAPYKGIVLDVPVIQDHPKREYSDAIINATNALRTGEVPTNEYPVVVLPLPKLLGEDYITVVRDGTSERLFPTKELIDLKPIK